MKAPTQQDLILSGLMAGRLAASDLARATGLTVKQVRRALSAAITQRLVLARASRMDPQVVVYGLSPRGKEMAPAIPQAAPTVARPYRRGVGYVLSPRGREAAELLDRHRRMGPLKES